MTEKEEKKSLHENEKKAENKGAGDNKPDEDPKAETKPDEDAKEAPQGHAFPIVGLGASAGGLDALKAFFSKIPDDSGMAYIVVSHMKPDQPSMLPELLQKTTQAPVATARDDCKIMPGHVYVIPPSKYIRVSKGKIRLTAVEKRGFNLPIDQFFRSLARGPGKQGGCDRPFRDRDRRLYRNQGDQKQGRSGPCAVAGNGAVRRNAPKRGRDGNRRRGAFAGGNAGNAEKGFSICNQPFWSKNRLWVAKAPSTG